VVKKAVLVYCGCCKSTAGTIEDSGKRKEKNKNKGDFRRLFAPENYWPFKTLIK
jgi:hypothetical protein